MKKELEELDKTTDIIKDFKSRMESEEETRNLDDLLSEYKSGKKNIEDVIIPDSDTSEIEKKKTSKNNLDKTLELNDLELDKTVVFDKTENIKEFLKKEELDEQLSKLFNNEDDIEEELKRGLNKRKKMKRVGIFLIVFSLLFVPILAFLDIISLHSKELVTDKICFYLYPISLAFCLLLVLGLLLVLSNVNIYLESKIKFIFKSIYICFLTFYVISLTTVLVLLYGPYTEFKDWLVTTAMATKDHQYYCKWFYNDNEINEVFERNFIEEPEGSTDEDLINIEEDYEPKVYANEYEKAVLEKDDYSDDYKLITFEVNGCKAYLAVIYDPAKVRVTTTDKIGVRGQYVTTMAKRENAIVAINGGGFYDPNYSSLGGSPKGIVIVNGKVVVNNTYGAVSTGGIIGFTKTNKLVLLKNTSASEAINKGVRDAVSWGPFLIVNGKAAYTKGNGGWGYAARTAIGQRSDGIVLFLVVDSNYNRTKGADMVDMTTIMKNYGAINAANLDGGTSSVMVVNGNMISHPIDSSLQNETRPIATSFILTK